jgi:hypothetical protein
MSYGTQVAEMLAAVSQLRARVALWLDVAAVISTLILLWVILSQVVTFVLGLSLLKGKNMFDRWVGSPAQ